MDIFLDKGHSLCCDQFFTSVPLFSWLLSRKTVGTGTLKATRKYTSKSLKKKKLPRDDIRSRQAGHLTQIRYQATKTKAVRILTTERNAETEEVTIRRKVNGVWQEVTIQKPVAISTDYNFFKVNVDVVDQLMSYNTILRKNQSFAQKGVHLMFDVILACIHSLLNHYTNPPPHLRYGRHVRRKLVTELVAEANAVAPLAMPGRKRKHIQAQFANGKRKRCKVCLKKGDKDKRSRFYCEGCDDHPALCVLHFAEYHRY